MKNFGPSFLHIGYSKAASTYLQYLLRNNDNINLVYKTNFFRSVVIKTSEKDKNEYLGFFKGFDTKKILIESQEHILLPFIHPELKVSCTNLNAVGIVCKNIKYVIPDVKIILVIRNQYDIIASRYLQYVLQGGEKSFDAFLEVLVLKNNYLKWLDYRYDKILIKIYEYFDKENVLILIHEDLKGNKQRFINDLGNFIGVKFVDYSPRLNQRNTGLSYKGVKYHRLLNKLTVSKIETPYSRTKTKGIFPFKLWKIMSSGIRYIDDKVVRNKRKNKLTSKKNIEYIYQVFNESNKNLERILNMDLSKYNYY